MKSLLAIPLFLLALNFSAWSVSQKSVKNLLQLNVKEIEAPRGVDIWMSSDQGKSWVMIGKTFKRGQGYSYKANESGLHQFHFHARRHKGDDYKPSMNSSVHQSIQIDQLEENNSKIIYSNKHSLNIVYHINDQGVHRNETFESWLYVTGNSGLTWRLYGPDTDKKSPIHFKATSDGLYGFKVISADMAGQKERAPIPGVPPDILVRIDTTAPQVNIISPQPQDIWESRTTRTIQWKAEDEALRSQGCVSLYYSIGDNQHWIKIAEGLPAQGGLGWKIPKSENGRIFIQVRAEDRARNIAHISMKKPFYTRNILADMLPKHVREQADAYYKTATICRENAQYPKSVKYYRLCLQLNPYHVRAHNDLAISLLTLNERDRAFEHFELGLKYSPSNEGLLTNLCRLYITHHQLEIAGRISVRLIHLYPKSVEGLWLAGVISKSNGNFSQARRFWKRITQLDIDMGTADYRRVLEAKKWLSRTLVQAEQAPQGVVLKLGVE